MAATKAPDLEEFFSDESSFCGNVLHFYGDYTGILISPGDEDTITEYEARVSAFHPQTFWDLHSLDLQTIAMQERENVPVGPSRKRKINQSSLASPNESPKSKNKRSKVENLADNSFDQSQDTSASSAPSTKALPYNLYEGEVYAKQLDESIEQFLARLQPSSTTDASIGGHRWLFVCNPVTSWRPESSKSVEIFRSEANVLLESLLEKRRDMEDEHPDKPVGAITRLMNPYRDQLELDLLDLAKRRGVRSGKWMIFCSTEDVDQIWAKIAEATWEGKLGHISKVSVLSSNNQPSPTTSDENNNDNRRRSHSTSSSRSAPTSGSPSYSFNKSVVPTNSSNIGSHPDRGHMIHIYTSDFSDETNVFQVAEQLRLLDTDQSNDGKDTKRPIYYKCDAYTYLDISNGNEYKLKASLYSNNDRNPSNAKSSLAASSDQTKSVQSGGRGGSSRFKRGGRRF